MSPKAGSSPSTENAPDRARPASDMSIFPRCRWTRISSTVGPPWLISVKRCASWSRTRSAARSRRRCCAASPPRLVSWRAGWRSDSGASTSRRRSTTCTVASARSIRWSAPAIRLRHRCTSRSSTASRWAPAHSTGATRDPSCMPTVASAHSCWTRRWAMPPPPQAIRASPQLEVRYRSTVPLGEPLLVRAELIDVLGVRAAIRGSISLEETPDDVLVEAEGRFLALRPEQAARLFGSRADGVD